MDDNIVSRIDRAVADNIRDIQRSFGSQSGLVQDFIVFISLQLKTDLFGYTRFTVQDFCKQTGRNRQDLAMIHSDFINNKNQPPIIQGYAFQTVFDFALYTMMERNIIFSSKYETKSNGDTISMHNFPILKDLRLNFDRRNNEQKVYEIRLSDELLYGFLSRYYTLNIVTYKLVGKGRGGESRKKLLVYLSKLSHVMQSTNSIEDMLIPLNRLCDFGDITDSKPSHRKQNLIRMLNYIQDIGKFPFKFEFVTGGGNSEYMVRLSFQPEVSKRKLLMEHTFYYRLMIGLKEIFDHKIEKISINEDIDGFQRWLSDKYVDNSIKARILSQAYYMAFNLNISQPHAISLIISGELLKPLIDVK